MLENKYVFDIIVNKILLNDKPYPSRDIKVEVEFFDVNLIITSFKEITLEDYREGRSYEFVMGEKQLGRRLRKSPLKFIIRRRDKILGTAEYVWSRLFIADVCSEDFSSKALLEEVDAYTDGIKNGKIVIIIRMTRKSEDTEIAECIKKQIGDEVIDPNDVLFVIGRENKHNIQKSPMNRCGKNNINCPARLDLARFRRMHGKIVPDSKVISPCGNLECCELQQDNDCDNLLESLCLPNRNKKKLKPNRMCLSEPQPQPGSSCPQRNNGSSSDLSACGEKMCRAKIHLDECPHADKCGRKRAGECDPEKSQQAQRIFNDPDWAKPEGGIICQPQAICNICCYDKGLIDRKSNCPQCGCKRNTHFDIKKGECVEGEKKQTLEEILKNWGTEMEKEIDQVDTKKQVCRCTCTPEKSCAYCRTAEVAKKILDTHQAECQETCDCKEKEDSSERLNRICHDMLGEKSECATKLPPPLDKLFDELKAIYSLPEKKKQPKPVEKCDVSTKSKTKSSTKNVEEPSSLPANTNEADYQGEPMPPTVESVQAEKECCLQRAKKKRCAYFKNLKECRKPNKKQYDAFKSKCVQRIDRHKDCVGQGSHVPRNMGWLWIESELAQRGWKPGTISRPIRAIMSFFLKDFPIDTLGNSKYCTKKQTPEEEKPLVQKPTLQITKRKGEYLITMRPLKDPNQLKASEDPYAHVKPIQFRISKNRITTCKRDIKQHLKTKGYSKCTCKQPVKSCNCRPLIEKERLDEEIEDLCEKMNIENVADSMYLTDTTESDSEVDIEFTPPVGLIKPWLKRKPDMATKETQYCEADYVIPKSIQVDIQDPVPVPTHAPAHFPIHAPVPNACSQYHRKCIDQKKIKEKPVPIRKKGKMRPCEPKRDKLEILRFRVCGRPKITIPSEGFMKLKEEMLKDRNIVPESRQLCHGRLMPDARAARKAAAVSESGMQPCCMVKCSDNRAGQFCAAERPLTGAEYIGALRTRKTGLMGNKMPYNVVYEVPCPQ